MNRPGGRRVGRAADRNLTAAARGRGPLAAPFACQVAHAVPAPSQGAIVVDLGAGPGRAAIGLHKLWPQSRIVCVDRSQEAVRAAERNIARAGVRGVEAILRRAEAIPFPAGAVDVVISRCSFHEWTDPRAGLSESHRVLKPGGSLVLRDYDRDWLSGWRKRLLERLHHLEMFRYTRGQVVGLVEAAGFVNVRAERKGWQYSIVAAEPPPGTPGPG
ncbi:MAG: class I SAM-dependent methyltransferase [Candidatus Bipolaricaulaceae bacterium]